VELSRNTGGDAGRLGCNVQDVFELSQENRVLDLNMATILTENVGLDFPIYGMQRSLRRTLFQSATGGFINKKDLQHRHVSVTALAGVSFQLSDGDRLALVGHNGAGKSSLLKVLAGIYYPTSGQVWVDGKIMSLFELTLGIDSEDTGYETIVTAGMLHGMTQAEIESKIPEIERFSELGEYLSLPVRTYSMGMTTRLGFSLATVFEPEILLLDEGIGAGDARFTDRASARLKELAKKSAILVLASHTDDLIRSICNKAALMNSGRLVKIGPVDEILSEYHTEKARSELQATPG
jgi:ABC-type polysaccharide/polyol phosphate transport system ATPase subunit